MNIPTWLILPKPCRSLLLIKDNIIAYALAKKADVTYSHCTKLLQYYKKDGLVEMNKKGRCIHLNLTEKGKELKNIILQMLEVFNHGA